MYATEYIVTSTFVAKLNVWKLKRFSSMDSIIPKFVKHVTCLSILGVQTKTKSRNEMKGLEEMLFHHFFL